MSNPENHGPEAKLAGRFRFFVPILAGATPRERAIACIGTLVSICLTGSICGLIFGVGPFLPFIIAPIGASAVLLFAVPASPLAQPWPIIGGNTISACVGLAVAHWVHEPVLATGLGVALAIAAMSLTRSLHPPGGAAALTMVLGGPALKLGGAILPVLPIALNSIILVALGYCFHRLSRRSYPHVATPVQPINEPRTHDAPPHQRVGVVGEDVDAALATLGQTFDIDRGDLNLLLEAAEQHALTRLHGTLLCKDILSRDVIKVSEGTSAKQARNLLLDHNIRTLPVVDASGKLRGVVGLRELVLGNQTIDGVIAAAPTAMEDDTAVSLLPILSDGHTHAVIILGHNQHIVGIITQSDMLASLGRLLLNAKI